MSMNDFDQLMNMAMDDVEDLPPVGIPPTGHYNFTVTATREKKDGGNEYVKFAYTIDTVNEVKLTAEQNQAAIGMNFFKSFSPLKKDGTCNKWGMKFLKAAVQPYASHFGATNFDKALAAINGVAIAATLMRTVDKKDSDRFNFRLADVVIL